MRRSFLLLAVLALGFAPAPFLVPKDARTRAEKARAGDLLLEYREFRDERWRDVFRWLSKQTDIPVAHSWVPRLTFTFDPQGKRLTSAEFLAVLNRDLAAYQFRVVLRPRSYLVVSADLGVGD